MNNITTTKWPCFIALAALELLPVSAWALCDRGQIVLNPVSGGDVSEAAGIIQLTASRIGGTCGRASVIVETLPATAELSVDYRARRQRLTWANGQGGDLAYTVTIVDDIRDEPDEAFSVAVTEANYPGLISASGSPIVTIADNDAPPTVRFGAGIHDVDEGNAINIPVRLSAPSGYDITVDLAYTGSATAADFAALPANFIIAKGTKSATLTLEATADGLPEADEQLRLEMTTAVNAAINTGNRYRLNVHDPVDTACPEGAERWSDPASWPAGVPVAGAAVEIPEGVHIALDTNTAPLAGLTVNGTLSFCRQDVALTADWILLTGELHVGSESEPFIHHADITLTGSNAAENIMGMGTRGLLVMDGVLELHGNAPEVTWTKINEHADANTTQLIMDQAVDWHVGDQIIIAPTDFYGVAETEQHQIAALNGQSVDLVNPLSAFHWGRLQYPTPTGMSLTNDNPVVPPAAPETGATPLVLDERAEVANLTRNIVIQAPDDTLWQQQGFGAHLMIMGQSSQTHIDGVEFHRVGQRHVTGRYPYHSHRRSYAADGSVLADVSGDYLRNSSIHESANRCITIHATNGLTVQNNICHDIRGHGIFFEDAVERRNIVENNLIMRVRNPDPGMALKLHELADYPGLPSGSSGLWVSNPDNTVRNNTAVDAQGFGLWMAFPAHPVGLSSNVAMIPNRLLFGNFDDNTAHSNDHEGVMLDESETDNLGNIASLQYWSTLDGQNCQYPCDNLRRFSIAGLNTWKNGLSGLWNRVVWPDYSEFVSADNQGRYFAGSGAEGNITRSLVVGTSLNNFTPRPHRFWGGAEVAFASYHSSYSMHDNIVINFPLVPSEPLVEGGRSGVFDTSDYYIRAVDKGHIRNTNNLIIDSHPGYRSPANFPHYVLSGALWDPNGIWGPANNWNVYDQPFFTHNANCVAVEPAGSSGAASCDGQYYGVDSFVVNQANEPYDATMAIAVSRFDENDTDSVVGNWNVANGLGLQPFPNKRHFAARHNGIYLLDFPEAIPEDVIFEVQNMHSADDRVVIGVRYSGLLNAQVAATTYNANNVNGYCNDAHCHSYTAVASLAEVISSNGETFWQDTANNIVWAKVQGGLTDAYVAPEDTLPFSDELMYRPFRLRIHD